MPPRLAALVVTVTFASCTCGTTNPPPETECVRNSDCARNRVCLDGLCVDGLTGGGTPAAGGTAMGGGQATAGGSTAGGAAGGFAGGAGGGSGGGAAGGVAGGAAGGSVTGTDGGLADAGVDAGAPDAGCQCTDLEECVGGLVCVPRYALLQWRSPSNGAVFSAGAAVPLEAALILASGRSRNDPASISFEASGDGGRVAGLLQRVDAGLFATSMSFPLGSWAATISIPDSGLADGPLTFSVLTSDFALTWAPPPPRVATPGLLPHDPSQDAGTFFRRDETATLVVTNSAPATNVSVTVLGVSSDGGTPPLPLTAAPSCASCSDAGFCACYPLDLSRPVLEAFRGHFSFSVSGTVNGSIVTNTSQTHPARVPSLPVTRWKWAWVNGPPAFDGGVATITNPALDRRGALYFGFSEFSTSFPSAGVKVLSHQGAVQLATQTLAVPTSDFVISSIDGGPETAVVATQGSGFVSLSPDGGLSTICDPSAGQGLLVTGAIGLLQTPPPVPLELPFGVATSSSSQLRRLVVAGPIGSCATGALTPANASSKSPFFASGQSVTFASAESGNVRLATATPFNVMFGGAAPLPPSLGALTDLFPPGLQGSQIAVGTSAGGVWWAGLSPASSMTGSASGSGVMATGNTLWYPTLGSGGLTLQSVTVDDSAGITAGPGYPIAAGGMATIALGQGGAVLAATSNGVLTVVQDGRIVWTTPADARLGGLFSSRLMLDCSRDGTNAPLPGRPGVAYLLGAPQQVQAIITDSRGLDVTQPWPMNGHDPRGTYNSATPLAPFACP